MEIIVCPLALAPELARTRKVARAVSLLDPGTTFPVLGLGEGLHFQSGIHDVEADMDGLDACRDHQMRAIVDFVSAWDRAAPMLVHCYAGISRSTATAYITACAHNPDADEAEIARTLRKASSGASPNRRFVALADEMLSRKGRMSAAIEAIGRGPSWFEIGANQPFSIPAHYEPHR